MHRAQRIMGSVLLCLMLLAPTVGAAHLSDIIQAPLASLVLRREPRDVGGGGLGGFGSFPGASEQDFTRNTTTLLDDETVLQAIALGRQANVTFTVAELSARDEDHERLTVVVTLPEPGPVLDALLIGTFDSPLVGRALQVVTGYLLLGVRSPPLPLTLLVLSDQSFRLTEESRQRVGLDAPTTESGLALLANGHAFDPHVLLTKEESGRALATFDQDALLAIPLAAALGALGGKVAPPVPLHQIQDSDLRFDQTAVRTREPSLDPDDTLRAIAIHQSGEPIEVEDLLDLRERDLTRDDFSQALEVDGPTLRSALVLGAAGNVSLELPILVQESAGSLAPGQTPYRPLPRVGIIDIFNEARNAER